jgi:phosphoglycolate phosphatase-like HAD superfamily hydrolase
LETVIEWSQDVNRMVQVTAINLPPMKGALEAMGILKNNVDLVVVSNTPLETLNREWSKNNINNNILYIGGQETGTKTQMLKAVAENKYDPDKILIIGDAPGDLRAAQNINALFFPILPLKEEVSWSEFNKVGYEHFINNSYTGEYQKNQIQKFQSVLNLAPPWEN